MAGRMIRVISAHVSRDVEKTYGLRSDTNKQFTFWKRQVRKREEPKYTHHPDNYWTQQHCFYFFFALLGNGFDTMPHTMRFALKISGGLFLVYEFFFSILITFPLLYTEMFLGKYSTLTNSQMYRMMPISFGICVLMLFQDILYTSMSSPSIAMALMGALDHLLRATWECPSKDTMCYDYKVEGPLDANCTRKHMILHCNGQKRLIVSMFYMHQTFLKRHDFQANWQLIFVTIITWIFIMVIVNLKMRILELLLKILFILSCILHLVLFLLAITSEGATTALFNMYDFKLRSTKVYSVILSAFLMPIKHNTLYGGGYMTYAASINYKSKLGLTTNSLLLLFANYALNIYYLMIFHSIIGVLGHYTKIDYKEVFFPFVGMYYAMVSEFLRFMNCPHVFIAIYHMTNWLLECAKLTIIIRMHINSLYDFFPTIVQFKIHTRIAWIGICTFIGLLDTMGICTKMVNEVMWMANLYMMSTCQLLIRSTLLFYGYGVSRLNDDIHFYSGNRPIKFWRIIWYIYPFMLFILLLTLVVNGWNSQEEINFIANDFQKHKLIESFWIICGSISAMVVFGLFIISFLYVVLQMRRSMRITLTTPLFHWGPPNKEDRIARKAFTPRVAIRSQTPKKRRQRFREHSVRQQHEREFAEDTKRGRLFLDKQFFSNLGLRKYRTASHEPQRKARLGEGFLSDMNIPMVAVERRSKKYSTT